MNIDLATFPPVSEENSEASFGDDGRQWNLSPPAPLHFCRPTPSIDAEVVDEFEDGEDEEQDFREALSLLETAKDAMTLMATCLDFKKEPSSEQEHYLATTLLDIKQFIAAFDGGERVKAKRPKPGPKPRLSAACVAMRHRECAKVNCDCHCHADEFDPWAIEGM
jgi:hypothetical protein